MSMPQASRELARYTSHLRASIDWLQRSVRPGQGGSSAYYSLLRGWSAPYPETSGYIIPTLLNAADFLRDHTLHDTAVGIGDWLLSLQHADGWWPGGLYVPGAALEPSVFNTAQILDGMVALAERTGKSVWLEAAGRGAIWLSRGVDSEGIWQLGNYRAGVNPSYYAQVAWPMLQVWQCTQDNEIRTAAERALSRIVAMRNPQGAIAGWGFDPGRPAFSHTIAYTLRGLIESAWVLDEWSRYGEPCAAALERLLRRAEFSHGRLPGAYFEDWQPVAWYSCLTGNSQVALCLLRLDEHVPDLRLVNAAAKLVDFVCSKQRTQGGLDGLRGAVAGSSPPWGRYMFMRYPNWAVKYHADALMMLSKRLQREGLQA